MLQGQRYKTVTREVQNYVMGLYGCPPGEIDPDMRRQIMGDRQPITHRPADDPAPPNTCWDHITNAYYPLRTKETR